MYVRQPDDAVYLPDESLLREYVLNEDGAIYMGTWDNIQGTPWNYGQVIITQKYLNPSPPTLNTLYFQKWIYLNCPIWAQKLSRQK